MCAIGAKLEIVGRGTKRGLGRPLQAETALDMSGFSGISLYEPEELVLEAGAGTPLSEIERTLAKNHQQLAFEPPDYSKLLGVHHRGTLGGLMACGLSGPRRIKAGAARDHILGLAGVSGRGEIFKAGGRVVKNVTGFDVAKLIDRVLWHAGGAHQHHGQGAAGRPRPRKPWSSTASAMPGRSRP